MIKRILNRDRNYRVEFRIYKGEKVIDGWFPVSKDGDESTLHTRIKAVINYIHPGCTLIAYVVK